MARLWRRWRPASIFDFFSSVHCHNDLGVAVANSLAGLQAGCRQVECAINGLGERAGNASLEEIVMLLHTRAPYLGLTTGIDTTEIARTSRLVSRLTGYPVQPNKAIVGRNAFAHECGHPPGRRAEGAHDLRDHGCYEHRPGGQLDRAGQALGPPRELRDETAAYELEWFDVQASSRRPPHATVCVRSPEGGEAVGSFTGDGPIDAIFHAINAATGIDAQLREFRVDAVTGGQDALGDTSVVLEVGAVVGSGQGVSTDILEAAARAYVRALSNGLRRQHAQAEAEAEAVPAPLGGLDVDPQARHLEPDARA